MKLNNILFCIVITVFLCFLSNTVLGIERGSNQSWIEEENINVNMNTNISNSQMDLGVFYNFFYKIFIFYSYYHLLVLLMIIIIAMLAITKENYKKIIFLISLIIILGFIQNEFLMTNGGSIDISEAEEILQAKFKTNAFLFFSLIKTALLVPIILLLLEKKKKKDNT